MQSRMAARTGKRSSRNKQLGRVGGSGKGKDSRETDSQSAMYTDAKAIALGFLTDLCVDGMSAGSEVARTLYNAIRNEDWSTLVSQEIDPASYSSAASFKRDYQLVSLLRKCAFLETGFDRKGRAITKWIEAERQCRNANTLIDAQLYGSAPDPEFLAILQRMRDFISRTLGKAPSVSALDCRFGPGSTQLVKRGITLPKKYGKTVCCTPSLLPHISDLVGYHWQPSEIRVSEGNTLSFVPKDAKVDRSICIEPDMNIFVQLGIGKALRERFRRYFDLETQADRNREFVALAQSKGFATIDLSSASDTISNALVHAVLPEDWYDLLDAARCRYTVIEGTIYENQKFSSMGNGFTFELETIIFYAACRAVGVAVEDLAVFGDDIIVPQAAAQAVVSSLHRLGFTVNERKTFLSGRFFESCGHDYFDGVFVRPFFWKDLKDPVDVIKMCNDVSRLSLSYFGREEHMYRKTHDAFVRLLKRHGWYAEIPDGFGDIGVVTDFDSATPKCDSTGYLTTKAVRFISSVVDNHRKTNAYVAALHRGRREDVTVTEDGTTPYTDTVRGEGVWKLIDWTVPAWAWTGHGPWLD